MRIMTDNFTTQDRISISLSVQAQTRSKLMGDLHWGINKILDEPGCIPENNSTEKSLRLKYSVHQSTCVVASASEASSSTLEQRPTYREDIKATDASIEPLAGKVSDRSDYPSMKTQADRCSNSFYKGNK